MVSSLAPLEVKVAPPRPPLQRGESSQTCQRRNDDLITVGGCAPCCRKVAEQAVFVEVDTGAIAGYAAALPPDRLLLPEMDPAIHFLGHGRDTLAYYLTLDAGRFHDIDRLTICADNLVPHVLQLDGILRYTKELAARIDNGEPLAAGSPEEVEIRGCAVHAGELIVAELLMRGEQANAMLLDNLLWHRGQEPFYRARPRHRTRTVFY